MYIPRAAEAALTSTPAVHFSFAIAWERRKYGYVHVRQCENSTTARTPSGARIRCDVHHSASFRLRVRRRDGACNGRKRRRLFLPRTPERKHPAGVSFLAAKKRAAARAANEPAVIEKELLGPPYVRSATARLRDVVVVAPSAALDAVAPLYGEPSPIVARAKEQHEVLVGTLHDYGIRIHPLEVRDDVGYATFVADCALVLEKGAILLRPHRIERRSQIAAVDGKLRELGVPVVGKIEAPGLLDGGDVVVVGDTAYVGVPNKKPRSNTLGRRQFADLAGTAGLRTVELSLDSSIPRLNDVFSAVDDDLVVAATDFVDTSALAGKLQIVSIPRGDEYGASVLALAPRRVLTNLRFRIAVPTLRKAKIEVVAIDLWEFGKVGGGPPSLVLPLRRG